MPKILPILFNPDMVRAILDERKTVTRRVIKPQPKSKLCYTFAGCDHGTWTYPSDTAHEYWGEEYRLPDCITEEDKKITWNPPYHTNDILYVRETWGISNMDYDDKTAYIVYKASGSEKDEGCRTVKLPNDKFEKLYDSMSENSPKWRPSINMPKEVARIWLRVTEVRAEKLQDMPHDAPLKEGIHFCECPDGFTWKSQTDVSNCYTTPMGAMRALWNSTIKKSDLDRYGWGANPWVWVIEFERCEKPKEV